MRKISFRDPLSEVYVDDNKVIRKIKKKDFLLFNDLFKQDFYKEMIQKNWVQKSYILNKENFIALTHQNIQHFTNLPAMT